MDFNYILDCPFLNWFNYFFPDKDQIAQRKQNHVNLNLARPCLRRDDVYSFEVESTDLKLVNPHIGLKSLGKITSA